MKMKFFSFCAVALLLANSNLHAQESHAILKAGINLSNVSVTNNGRVNDANALASFQAGLIGDIPLGTKLFTFQPGIIFTGKGSKAQSGDENSATYWKSTFNPYYIEVPANFVLKFPLERGVKLFAGAGPYIAAGVGGKNKVEGKFLGASFNSEKSIEFSNDDPTTTNYQEGAGYGIIRRFDYGLNGLFGIETRSVVLGANYGYGLTKLQSTGNNSANDNNKYRVWSFTLGFKL